MEKTYSELTVSRRADGDYPFDRLAESKYVVSSGVYGYTGFDTKVEFDKWLDRMNLKAHLIDGSPSEKEWGYYRVDGFIVEKLFWDLSEVPSEADMFAGYSNGTIVSCFSLKTEHGAIVWRPNPNAKDVYQCLSIKEYAKFKRRDSTKR